jgi:hypothetical protein
MYRSLGSAFCIEYLQSRKIENLVRFPWSSLRPRMNTAFSFLLMLLKVWRRQSRRKRGYVGSKRNTNESRTPNITLSFMLIVNQALLLLIIVPLSSLPGGVQVDRVSRLLPRISILPIHRLYLTARLLELVMVCLRIFHVHRHLFALHLSIFRGQ